MPRNLLPVVLMGWFAGQFDMFVVNVAAPTIGRELGAGPVAVELLVGGYAFCFAAGLITGGRLGDLIGHREMLAGGLAAFGVTSLLCGVAQSPVELVGARMLQGLSAAVMVPQVLALITATTTGDARARAIGWYGVTGGLASVAGQVLGGLLVGVGWRWIFFMTVPLGLVGAVLAMRMLPKVPRRPAGLDVRGSAGLAVSFGLVMAPLVVARGWLWVLPAVAVPVFLATWRWQRTLAARGGSPVLAPALLRVAGYGRGLVATGAFGAYFGGFMFVLTLFLQGGLGLTPVQAGLAFVPMAVTFALASALGRGPTYAGVLVQAVGVVGLVLLAHAGWWFVAALAVIGAGNGMVLPRLIGRALAEVPADRAGVGSALLATTQQFAAAAGVAGLGGLYFARKGLWMVTVVELALLVVVVAAGSLRVREPAEPALASR